MSLDLLLGKNRGVYNKSIDATTPRPDVGGMARHAGDRLLVQPEHQPCPHLHRQPLAHQIERLPRRVVHPDAGAEQVNHLMVARCLDQTAFQRGHITRHWLMQHDFDAAQAGALLQFPK